MKLHYLEFEGIGPFREQVRIDFESVGTSGLFLLEGNTGTGKSTIIDAIVFALFGKVAADGASEDRIHSHFMPPGTPSYVDLFFEVPNGLFRIRRTPKFERPKLRGTGTKTENPTVKLWRMHSPQAMARAIARDDRADDASAISTRTDDANTAVKNLLGLTREQFTQIVVLPQGEFARFLKADTNNRQELLEKVFGTQFYRVIEDQFAEARRLAKDDTEKSLGKIRAGFERLIEAAGYSADEREAALAAAGEFGPTGIESALESGDAAKLSAGEAVRNATERERGAKAAADRAEEQHRALEERARLIERKRDLDTKVARRDSLQVGVNSAKETLAGHDAAEKPHYALDDRDKAQNRLRDAAANVPEQLRDKADEWPDALAQAEHDRDRAQEGASALTSAVQRELELPKKKKALDAAEKLRTECARRAKDAEERVASRPQQRASLEARVSELDAAAGKLEERRSHVGLIEGRVRDAGQAAAHSKDLSRLVERAKKAQLAANAAVDHVQGLRKSRISAMVVELAGKLEPGEPCTVCGSTEHPNPATTDAELVDDAAIEAAEQDRERKEKAFRELSEQIAGLKAALAAAISAATGCEHPQEEVDAAALKVAVEKELADARALLEISRAAQGERETVKEQLEKFDADTAALASTAHDAKLKQERANAEHEALLAQYKAAAAENEKDRGEFPSVAARQKELQGVAREHAARVEVLRTAVLAREQHLESSRVADALITESAFLDEAAVRAARLSPARKSELEREVSAFAALEAQIAEAQADDALEGVDASEEQRALIAAHIEKSQAAREEARARYTSAATARATSAGIEERTVAALSGFQTIVAGHKATSARQAQVMHLANIVTGNSKDSAAKLRLSTFVVMRRFEKVVEAANARLSTLADGVLELSLAELSSTGLKKVGLDLDVIDRRTDTRRSPSTLSGGETFFVSLALALGLADVVSAESGGTEMNTLFIDEGFGSLDPEKLDGVIAEIRHLASHGRTVGIVSHVAELKTQIAEKIHVSRLPDGTSTVAVTA